MRFQPGALGVGLGMAQIFHPSMNIVAKVTIFGGLLILTAIAFAGGAFVRSPYMTQVNVVRSQPVPFSHQHHVSELGLDCRYCHTSVETSAFAGLPPTEICMGCHSQIWKNSEMLAPVRDSFAKGKPLQWTRVHDLPDFVYFNHSIHIAKGVGCESCHGRVDEMPLMRRAASLHMEWCVKCHRHPERNVRPRDEIFHFGIQHPVLSETTSDPVIRTTTPERNVARNPQSVGKGGQELADRTQPRSNGQQLIKEYGIVTKQLTDCAVCHR